MCRYFQKQSALSVCVCLAGGRCVTWKIYEVAQGLSAPLGMTDVSGQGGRGGRTVGGVGASDLTAPPRVNLFRRPHLSPGLPALDLYGLFIFSPFSFLPRLFSSSDSLSCLVSVFLWSLVIRSVVCGPGAAASPGSLLEWRPSGPTLRFVGIPGTVKVWDIASSLYSHFFFSALNLITVFLLTVPPCFFAFLPPLFSLSYCFLPPSPLFLSFLFLISFIHSFIHELTYSLSSI